MDPRNYIELYHGSSHAKYDNFFRQIRLRSYLRHLENQLAEHGHADHYGKPPQIPGLPVLLLEPYKLVPYEIPESVYYELVFNSGRPPALQDIPYSAALGIVRITDRHEQVRFIARIEQVAEFLSADNNSARTALIQKMEMADYLKLYSGLALYPGLLYQDEFSSLEKLAIFQEIMRRNGERFNFKQDIVDIIKDCGQNSPYRALQGKPEGRVSAMLRRLTAFTRPADSDPPAPSAISVVRHLNV